MKMGRFSVRPFDLKEAEGCALLFFSILRNLNHYEKLLSGIASVKPVFFFHDIIPLTLPETCGPGEPEVFEKFYAFFCRHGKLLLTS